MYNTNSITEACDGKKNKFHKVTVNNRTLSKFTWLIN